MNADGMGIGWSVAMFENAFRSHDLYAMMLAGWHGVNSITKWHDHNAPPDPNGAYRGRGFVARSYAPLVEAPVCPPDSFRTFSAAQCAALGLMRELCAEHGAELVLLNPPQLCPETFDVPACWEGLHVIDGMNWPERNRPEHYYDDHHLVAAGAERYSVWVAEQVANRVGR